MGKNKIRGKKRNNGLKIILLILGLIIVGGLLLVGLYYNDKKNKELEYEKLLLSIRDSYNTYIESKSEIDLYKLDNDEYMVSGSVSKGVDLELEEVDIDNYTEEYFKLKNLDYYVNYKDISKIESLEIGNTDYKKYILFNENIVIDRDTKIYINEEEYYQVDEELSLPIIIKEDNSYYVEYDNRLVYVNKDDVLEIRESNNTDLEETTGIAVLNYHYVISREANEHLECVQTICHTDTQFEEHIKYMSDNGFYGIKVRDLDLFIDGKIRLPKKSVLITIDDGWYVYRAIPILEKYNMNATLFLIGSLAPVSDYTSVNLEIHSHTWNLHGQWGAFINASKETVIEDLKTSRESLNNTTYFCYPFYQYNNNVISYLKEAGFTMAFADGQRKVVRGTNKFIIPRYVILNNTSVNSLARMVN